MDESYLEWLVSIPGSDPERARRIAERFPTYDLLRSATRDELAGIEGMTPAAIDDILGLLGKSTDEDSPHLFLCPQCRSFVGTSGRTCTFCGVEFERSGETGLSEDLDTFLKEEEAPDRTCDTCGAGMARDATACAVCGRKPDSTGLAPHPGTGGPIEGAAPFCTRCGAYLFADESECDNCGTSVVKASTPSESALAAKGAVKDFLTRWQRMASAGTPTSETERLQEELDHYDRLLEADSTLERAWANRAKVLQKLGRVKEAAESLAKAADANPARDGEYRLAVQNLLRHIADAPVLPPRWTQPAATAPPKTVDLHLIDALAHYEALLRADPSLVVAWRTKAEILDRLGRPEEARRSREQADRSESRDDRSLRAAVEGLRSTGLSTAGLSSGGFTNGRTNGSRSGRTNGRVNGLAEGRVNGGTTGAVNGLTLGRGATNGLVNGNGFTNGRRGRSGTSRIPEQPHWSRSVVGIAAVVALMLVVPILASMLSPAPAAPSALIRIDGEFDDWASFPEYIDSPEDQVQRPGVNLVSLKFATEEQELFVHARVQGLWFDGPSASGTSSAFVFVDQDDNLSTGYPIGDLGADAVAEVYGWRGPSGIVSGVAAYRFDDSLGPASNDWRRFVPAGSANAAFRGSDLELRMSLAGEPAQSRVLVYAADSEGARDPADGSVRPNKPLVVLREQALAPDVIAGTTAGVLRVDLTPMGGIPWVEALNVTRAGTSTDDATLVLYRDNGDAILDAADSVLSTTALDGPVATLPVGLPLAGPVVFWIEARWLNITPASTFGLSTNAVSTNGTASFRPSESALSYLGAPPASPVVDGAFGDWLGLPFGTDPSGDVTNRSGDLQYNANVDILRTAVHLAANFTAFARVDGRLLGGEDIPTSRVRTGATPIDSDLDGVPDAVEQALGSVLSFDFNNDNVTDAQSFGDVDGDGILDYPDGQDCWLNTTIPGWYPAPYAGRFVARFVCPIVQGPLEGVDVLYIYVDADNATATGLLTPVDGRLYGFDYAIATVGRNGAISSSGLYVHTPGAANPWTFAQSIDAELDAHRIEVGLDASALNLSPGYRIVFFASDWRQGSDAALPDDGVAPLRIGPRSGEPGPGPFAAGGGVQLLDLGAGETFWLLDAVHSTEASCTTNRVAGPTPGTGPAASISLGTGESACWYLDTSAGETIPAGTWQALLDLVLAHGLAAYGEASFSTPRYREWSGSFGPEASTGPAAVVPEWVVLAASPLGPEMTLGVLASNQVLYVQTWDGTMWTSNWQANLGDGKTRRFDIAYEEQSGDVVVPFGDGTNQLKYRRRAGGVWDSQAQALGDALADSPFYVRVGARPTNDDMFVAVVTNAQTLHALRWDGTSNAWGNQVQMSVNPAAKDQEAFDIVFERGSGDAWVLWGTETPAIRSRQFTTAWQAEANAYSLPDKPIWVVADYDRRGASDTFAVAMTLANNNLEFGAWDGTAWVGRPSPVAARDKAQRGIDVAFESDSGRAMFAFNRNSNPGQLSWLTWTLTGGFSAVTAVPGTSASVAIVQLRSDPRSNAIMALYSDEDARLYHRIWDGSTWSALGSALEASLSVHKDKEAFMFAWTHVVEFDMHFEIWNMTTDTVVQVVGSCLDLLAHGDDVECLISEVPTMALGPDEVVRIRVAHSSTGGAFSILVAGGGSGTTGDSRLTIAIPELSDMIFVVIVPVVIAVLRIRARRRKATVSF